MKKILITGANSYIGTSVEKWLLKTPDNFQVDTLDMIDPKWNEHDFSKYDSIFHVAGIAHFSKDESKKALYYKINTDLTESVALKAKEQNVKQFIFMSSIIVYGDSTSKERIITKDTEPSPSDFYGDSKLQAELKLKTLSDDNFKIVIVRPPMIYGKGSKGNYPRLSKLAKRLPVFPDFKNQRSMLHIDNLSEFIKQIILRQEEGVFFPQNKEYVSTSELVSEIAKVHHHKVYLTKIGNPLIRLLFFNDNIKKIFGNLIYEKKMSEYNFGYQIRDFKESITITES
ncbi:NAD-dependent epimerase/dehydratase family protein [Streptococcus jiangjianxini]|uniref:NAD-dependent epimerase/dehydratase family protein n=1 Tax=Streptococcus jiangjianxini TaxID=3161189 RepID=UPI0032EF177B